MYNGEALPDNACVAVTTVTNLPQRVRMNYYEDTEEAENKEATDDEEEEAGVRTLQDQLDLVDESLQWLIKDIDLPRDEGTAIAHAITTRNGKCMSDGSLKDLLGTSACTFLLANDENTYVGRNVVPEEDDY